MKKKVLLGLAISLLFLYLAFRNVDFASMLEALQGVNYWWLLPGIGFMFISLAIRAYRWGYFIRPLREVPFRKLYSAMMIGYMANNVFPLRLGEVMRAYVIGRSANISKTSSFATILVERIIDVISLVVILGITIFFGEFPDYIQKAGWLIFTFAVSMVLFIILLMEKTRATLRSVWILSSPFPTRIKKSINRLLRKFLAGFEVFRQTSQYFTIIMQSISLWLLYAGIIYVTFIAFDIEPAHSSLFVASLVLLVMISIGIMIPSSPGFVGTYHLLCKEGLALFGVGANEAISFAIVLHILNYIPMTLVGFYYFWKENLHFKDALAEKEVVEQEIAKSADLRPLPEQVDKE